MAGRRLSSMKCMGQKPDCRGVKKTNTGREEKTMRVDSMLRETREIRW